MKINSNVSIHPSAIVDDGAKLGNGTNIWHWTHVSSNAKIGQNCNLGQNVFVGNKVQVGNNVKIQNNVSIYDNVIIEDDVFCGPSAVFTNVINPRAFVNRKDQYKTTLVKKGSSLGANCTIVCGVIIGEYSFIAAGAVVVKNVKPFSLVMGVPAKHVGWISPYGEKIPLPLKGSGEWTCPHTEEIFKLVNENLYKH